MKNKILTAVILGGAVLAALYLFNNEFRDAPTDELSGMDAPATETAAEQSATTVAVQAAACALKGELEYEGRKIEVNDCMRNDGLAPDAFQATCEWVADYGSAYGERPSVTYVDSCPAAHQGACDTFFERPITVFYYRTNPEDLASMKSSCDMQKGRWTVGGATQTSMEATPSTAAQAPPENQSATSAEASPAPVTP